MPKIALHGQNNHSGNQKKIAVNKHRLTKPANEVIQKNIETYRFQITPNRTALEFSMPLCGSEQRNETRGQKTGIHPIGFGVEIHDDDCTDQKRLKLSTHNNFAKTELKLET